MHKPCLAVDRSTSCTPCTSPNAPSLPLSKTAPWYTLQLWIATSVQQQDDALWPAGVDDAPKELLLWMGNSLTQPNWSSVGLVETSDGDQVTMYCTSIYLIFRLLNKIISWAWNSWVFQQRPPYGHRWQLQNWRMELWGPLRGPTGPISKLRRPKTANIPFAL